MRIDHTCEKRMDELAGRASQTGLIQYSHFLTPAEQLQAQVSGKKFYCDILFWGGFPEAERKIASFTDSGMNPSWPIETILFTWNDRFGSVAHRDLLGAIMALGIDRERYGDILVMKGCAYVVLQHDIAEYVSSAVQMAGRMTVHGKITDEIPTLTATGGEETRCVVSSLRLDALVSAAWKISRSHAQEIITSGRAQVDYCPEIRPDRIIHEDALVSVRGLGRFKAMGIAGKTKKNRFCVMLMRQ